MHFVLRIGLALALSVRVVARIDASQLSVVVVVLRLGTEAFFLFPNICICLFIWGGGGGGGGAMRARTKVSTDTRPSCARRKTARNRVTAEICWVTANVLITYDRQFSSPRYAEGKFQRSTVPCDVHGCMDAWMYGGCETEEGALAGVSLQFRERKVKSAIFK